MLIYSIYNLFRLYNVTCIFSGLIIWFWITKCSSLGRLFLLFSAFLSWLKFFVRAELGYKAMGFTDVFAYVYAILSYPSPSLILSSFGLSLPTWSSCLLPCYPYSILPPTL